MWERKQRNVLELTMNFAHIISKNKRFSLFANKHS